jgi:hypothetical protein
VWTEDVSHGYRLWYRSGLFVQTNAVEALTPGPIVLIDADIAGNDLKSPALLVHKIYL